MWSHLLPLAGPDIHDVHIAGSASKPYACVCCTLSVSKVLIHKQQVYLCHVAVAHLLWKQAQEKLEVYRL